MPLMSVLLFDGVKAHSALARTDSPKRFLSSIVENNKVSPYTMDSSTPTPPPAATPATQRSHSNNTHMRNSSGTGTASRSISMASVSSEGSVESTGGVGGGGGGHMEQEDIVQLTQEVRAFKEALGKMRRILPSEFRDKDDTSPRSIAHEKLGEVLRILRNILEKYPPLQSTELLMAAGALIQQVKGFSYEDVDANPAEFFEAIDLLALSFSSRVSEYLMGDLDSASSVVSSKTKSCDNILGLEDKSEDGKEPEGLSHEQTDAVLLRLEQGVEYALHRAKVWAKYAKDVMAYVEKRALLELEYSRNLAKLAQSMKPALKEESYLPFQSVYCTALDQDVENCANSQRTTNLIQGHKFLEPLSSRRFEHEKKRKNLKETWTREVKRMQDAVTNLRKARMAYVTRQQELVRAREATMRLRDASGPQEEKEAAKKRRVEDEAVQRAMEAETTYKACVAEANERHGALLAVKASVIQAAREIILQCDQTMKAVTVAYFQLQHAVSAAAPVQFQTLCESSRLYEPGSQYIEFVRRLPRPPLDEPVEMSPYSFEPFAAQDEERRKGSGPPDTDDRRRKAWSGGPLFPSASACDMKLASGGVSDTDSLSSHGGGIPPHHLVPESGRASIASSGDDLDVPGGASQQASRRSVMSKAAKTHTFRNLKTPSRCRECDSYIYFQGADCMECGLCVHKKCLETLAIQCGHKRLPRKTTTFSLDISQHLSEAGVLVPHLVTKCVSEIERRGMKVKGIYRVSGVKSRVEKLCQAFENGAELVDVTEVHPNVIANVLKLYLRQLPEPLLTYKLYPEFVRLAKECPSDTAVDIDDRIQDLRELCAHLPEKHQPTLSYLMHHLRRVSEESDTNNMPPSNLGIVFGPTLLRMAEGAASLNSLVDTIHQTRAIEMLVVHADTIFGPPPNLSPQYSTALQRSPASRSESIDSTGSNTSLGTSPGAGGRGAGSGGSGGTSSSSSGTASSGTAGFLKPLMRSLSSVSGAQAMAGGKTKQVSPVLRSPVSQGDGSCSPVVERREGLPSAELLAARSVVLPGYIAGVEDSLPPSTTHPDRGVSSEPQSAGASDDDLSIELPDESDQRRSPLLRRIGSPSGSPSQQFSSPQTGTWPSPLPKPSAETRQSTSPVTGTGQGTRSQVDSGITDSSLDSDLSLDVAETRYKGRHQVEDVEIGPRAGGASLDNLTSSESSQDVNEDYEGYLDVRGSDTSLTSSPNLMGFVLQSSDADFIDGGSSCETHSSSLRVDSPRAPRSPSSSTSSASAPVDTSSPLSSQGPSRVKIELPSSSIMSGLPSEKLVRSILDPSKLGGKHPEIITTSVRKGITSSSNPSATRHTPKNVPSPKNETGLSKQGQEKFV